MHAAMGTLVRIAGAAGLCLVASLAAAQPVPVSDAGRRAQAPDVAIARDGSIHVAWLDKGSLGALEKEGKDKAPSGHTHQAWADVYYARSRDGGRTFSTPARVNGESDQDLSAVVQGGLAQAHVFGTMAIGPEGDVYTFWLDTRIMTADWPVSSVYMAVSRDGGRTFADRVPVSGPRWIFEACPLKPTALATEGAHLHTAVFNGAESPAGVYFSRSGDGARSFDPAIKLHPDAGVSDAPSLVATPSALYAFWHAKVGGERRVYLRVSTDRGSTFGPVQELPAPAGAAGYPAAAGLPDGRALLVWQQGEQILATVVDPPTRVAARKR